MTRTPLPRRQAGFTLIELLVVIAIIAILIGLLVPAVQKVREAAARTQCQNNMKQIGLAMHMYQDSKKMLPPGWLVSLAGGAPNPGWGWGTMILPYIEQGSLYNQLAPDLTGLTPMPASTASPLLIQPVPVYMCPSDSSPLTVATLNGYGRASYVANRYVLGPDVNSKGTRMTVQGIPDGSSNTAMMGERDYVKNPGAIWPGRAAATTSSFEGRGGFGLNTPNPNLNTGTGDCRRLQFSSMHTGGVNFVFADGSVRFVSDNIEANPALDHCQLPATGGGNFALQNMLFHADGNPNIGDY